MSRQSLAFWGVLVIFWGTSVAAQGMSVLDRIQEIETRVNEIEETLKILHYRQKSLQSELLVIDRRIRQFEQGSQEIRKTLKIYFTQIRILDSDVDLIVSLNSDISDNYKRQRYLEYLLRVSRKLWADFQDWELQLRNLRQKQNYLTSENLRVNEALATLDIEFEELREARTRLRGSVRSEEVRFATFDLELEQAEQDFYNVVKSNPVKRKGNLYSRKDRLSLPTKGERIARFGRLDNHTRLTQRRHYGISFSGKEGDEVRTVFRGRVLYAEYFKGFGNVVVVDHGGGYQSFYAHLSSFEVSPGNKVSSKQIIGRLGQTGTLDEVHLFFGLLKGGRPINPSYWFYQYR